MGLDPFAGTGLMDRQCPAGYDPHQWEREQIQQVSDQDKGRLLAFLAQHWDAMWQDMPVEAAARKRAPR
jgi:hypothetical protein